MHLLTSRKESTANLCFQCQCFTAFKLMLILLFYLCFTQQFFRVELSIILETVVSQCIETLLLRYCCMYFLTMTSCRIIISVTIMEFDFDFFSRFWYQSVGAKERTLSMYSCSFLNQCWSHSRSEKSIVEQVQAETSSRNKGGKHSYKTQTVFDEKGTAPPVASLSLLLREPYSLGISREHKQKITADIHKTSWNSLNEKDRKSVV